MFFCSVLSVVEEFASWIEPRSKHFENCLVPELKIAVFRLMNAQKNVQIVKMVFDIYQLSKHNHFFVENIEVKLKEKVMKFFGLIFFVSRQFRK